jgi:hypothetical protein
MLVNQYTQTPFHVALAREMLYFTRRSYLFVKNRLQNKTILFYPDYPFRRAEIWKIIARTSYNATNNPNQHFDLVFHWQDTTLRTNDSFLAAISLQYPVINLRSVDIGKDTVEAVFSEVFGYSSLVDPLTYQGKCVKKTILNGKHDGKIIDCPVAQPEPGYIYQLLVDTVGPDQQALDYRVPVFKRNIPFMLLRYKHVQDRFDNTMLARLADPANIFSAEELDKIIAFCEKMGLEYGELDILRNQADGRIYIVDANNTPSSPPSFVPFDKTERRIMLQKSVEAFEQNFLNVLK